MYTLPFSHAEAKKAALLVQAHLRGFVDCEPLVLHWAAKVLDRALVDELLQVGVQIDCVDGLNETALHVAEKYSTALTHLMLEKGAATIDTVESHAHPLFSAISRGDTDQVRLLLAPDAALKVVDAKGRTPLHMAALTGQTDLVRWFLEKGAAVDAVDRNGLSPLHGAALTGYTVPFLLKNQAAGALGKWHHQSSDCRVAPDHLGVMRVLLKYGASVHRQDRWGHTPLHGAASSGREDLICLLLEHGASIDAWTQAGNRPIYMAAREGHAHVMGLLLQQGATIDCVNNDGKYPLHVAARNGHKEVVRVLLDRGASIEAADHKGYTPLQEAAHNGYVEVVRVLLDRGASIEAADDFFRKTSLNEAARNGYIEVVRVLLDRGASIEAADRYGQTPLHRAAQNGHKEVVRVLLDRGASTEAADQDGYTPLHWAALNGGTEIVRMLLDRGAFTEAADRYGHTPLHWAAENGHTENVRMLLDRGASTEAADQNGYTPLYKAVLNGGTEIVRMLLDRGASTEAADQNGKTPLYWAARNGHIEIVRMLLEKGASIVTGNNRLNPLDYERFHKNTDTPCLLALYGAYSDTTILRKSITPFLQLHEYLQVAQKHLDHKQELPVEITAAWFALHENGFDLEQKLVDVSPKHYQQALQCFGAYADVFYGKRMGLLTETLAARLEEKTEPPSIPPIRLVAMQYLQSQPKKISNGKALSEQINALLRRYAYIDPTKRDIWDVQEPLQTYWNKIDDVSRQDGIAAQIWAVNWKKQVFYYKHMRLSVFLDHLERDLEKGFWTLCGMLQPPLEVLSAKKVTTWASNYVAHSAIELVLHHKGLKKHTPQYGWWYKFYEEIQELVTREYPVKTDLVYFFEVLFEKWEADRENTFNLLHVQKAKIKKLHQYIDREQVKNATEDFWKELDQKILEVPDTNSQMVTVLRDLRMVTVLRELRAKTNRIPATQPAYTGPNMRAL